MSHVNLNSANASVLEDLIEISQPRAIDTVLVVFDSRVDDLPQLLAGLQPGVQAHVLEPACDGIEHISNLLQQQPTSSLTLVAHGFPGGLQLGAGTLELNNVQNYANQLQTWFTGQNAPELNLLACKAAAGDAGAEFVEKLTTLTGAAVSASKTVVGHGNWPTVASQILQPSVLLSYSATLQLTFDSVFDNGVTAGVTQLDTPLGIAFTSDGSQVFVASETSGSLTVFDRDAGGNLTINTVFDSNSAGVNDLAGAARVTVSPDDSQVFVVSRATGELTVFDRDAGGNLTVNSFFNNNSAGVSDLAGARSVAISSDGSQVFVASQNDNALVVFDRDAGGNLTFNTSFKDDVTKLLDGAVDVEVSPDGSQVFVVSTVDDALTVFDRDAGGNLTINNTFAGLDFAFDVAVSPDGKQVFVASFSNNSLTVFDRDALNGTLTLNNTYTGLVGANGVTVSPDGTQVFVANFTADSVAVFDRNAANGTLTANSSVINNTTTGVNQLDGAVGVAVSPDGTQTFVTSFNDDALTVFDNSAGAAPELSSITLKTPATSPTNADTLVFLATFSEDVKDVDGTDFVVDGTTTATVTNVNQLTASTYDITVSGGDLAGFNGAVGIDLAGGQDIANLSDVALDGTEPATDETYTLDNTTPTATSFTRKTPATSPTNEDTLVFLATFDEDVTGVDNTDFVATGTTGATVAVSQVTASTYDITVSGGDLAGFNGTVGIDFAGAANITDSAGNALTVAEPATDETYAVSNVVAAAPTATSFTLKTPGTSPTNADTLVFLATFSEDVKNVDVSDFAVDSTTTATVTNVTQLTASTYDITVSGGDLAGFNGAVGIDLAGGQDIANLSDVALDGTEPATDETYTLDNTAPTATSFTRKTPATSPTNEDTLVFLATFGEDVTGVDNTDFVATGTIGATVAVSQVTASTYDITVSGGDLAGFNGDVGINFAGAANITDSVGNVLTVAEPATDETYTVDNTSLSVAITNVPATVTAPFTATFEFSEDVSDFVLADIAVTNGTPSDFNTVDNKTYTALITPAAPGAVNIDVNANVATNALGGQNLAATQVTTVFDVAPVLISISRKTPNEATTSADSLVFQATFSEAVQNVDTADFAVTGGTTATITDVTQVSAGVYDITVSGGDLADFNGTVGLDVVAGQDITDLTNNALPADEPATDETYTIDNINTSVEAQLTPKSDTQILEVTSLGDSANTIRLTLEQVNIPEVSEILVFSTDATGSNRTQIGSVSLLQGGDLPGTYAPGLTLESSEVSDGEYLQFEIVVGEVTRTATLTATSDTEVTLDFGDGTTFNVELFNQTTTTNLLMDDAAAIDFTGQTGNVNVNFTVYREAAQDNTVGVYATDFADGGIITDELTGTILRPGDAGYKEAALAKQLDVQLTGQNGQVSSFEATLTGGGYLATFLVADGSDPAAADVYFSHAGANDNNNDHAKLLGDNIVGFEDIGGLGDKDFNDVVVEIAVA